MSSPAGSTAAPRTSFRQQILRVREDAIVSAVNRLLAEKGFEAMTVDEVAAEVGIAKASLYKHFPSKEELAAAAMVRVLDRALAFLDQEAARPGNATEHLRAVVRWMLQAQLAGEMPSLPAQNSILRTALMQHRTYLDRVMTVSERLGGWITAAQAAGQIDARLPAEAVLYTLYARACDPVVAFLRAGGRLTDDEVVEVVLSTCFDGLATRA
jgi:TetR/AcrR family transcriptional regulator, regulator of autoinduction and epiphytic fitness